VSIENNYYRRKYQITIKQTPVYLKEQGKTIFCGQCRPRREAHSGDPDHPHHSNGEDPVHRKPREHSSHHNYDRHLCGWNFPSFHLGRWRPWIRSVALALLAFGRNYAVELCDTDTPCEGVVRAPLGNVGNGISSPPTFDQVR
jgi:hypothetical protein